MFGLILTILTGIMWALVGVMLSTAARRKMHPVAFGLASCTVSLAFLLVYGLFSVDWQIFSPAYWSTLSPSYSMPVIIFQSIAGVGGFWLIQAAMRRGPNALVWGVGQSAIVIPFFVSVLLWNEQVSILKLVGLLGILCCIVTLTLKRYQTPGQAQATWLVLALMALLAIGAQQSLSLVLSHDAAWRNDNGLWLRIVLEQLLNMIMTLGACALLRTFAGKAEFRLGLANAVVVLLGRVFFLQASDRMAVLGLSSVVYPIAIGVCITVFGLFCWIRLREHLTTFQVTGLIVGILGIVCIALP